MTTVSTENGDNGEIMRSISWQYDNATNLVGLVTMIRDFFNASTKDFWDGTIDAMDISDPLKATDASLAIWGSILGVERPLITYEDDSQEPMSKELYRKILVGRYRLMNSNASQDAYLDYVKFVFGGNVKVIFGEDMSIGFTYMKTSEDADYNEEIANAIEQFPYVCFAFPAGVEDNTPYYGKVFGFTETQDEELDEDETILPKFDGAPISWF